MRRDRFAPVDELRELRAGEGVRRFETPFGANVWIVTRYADVREVLSSLESNERATETALEAIKAFEAAGWVENVGSLVQ